MTETALFLGASSPASEDFTWKTKAPLRPWYTSYQYLANHIWIQNGLVNSVLIREQQYLTFQMVVDRYGEPEITAIGNPDAFGLEDLFLLYPSKGLAFMGTFRIDQVGFQSDTPTPNIYVDSEIYFQPMRVADLTVEIVATGWRASGSIEGIFPWRGFGHPVR